ncbi:MAG: hypothetical protein JKY54_10905 [Flavobacteriales bacterium]|nr:hypothetical protein [Flavobacteriales bacterium]
MMNRIIICASLLLLVLFVGCTSNLIGVELFSISTTASPSELEDLGFEISTDYNTAGESVWYGNLNNHNYYVSAGFTNGKMSHLGININVSYFESITGVTAMDYDSVEIEHSFYSVVHHVAEENLFVSRLGL